MLESEIRLPKFLTQEEAMFLEWYNKDLCKDAEEQDLDVDIACEGGSIFLYHNSEFLSRVENTTLIRKCLGQTAPHAVL